MNLTLLMDVLHSLSLVDYSVIIANIVLIAFARQIITRISSPTVEAKTIKMRLNLLRGMNILILTVYGYRYFYKPSGGDSHSIQLLSILAILYFAYFSHFLLHYYIYRLYGKQRKINDKVLHIETYQTRLLSLLATILVTVITIISVTHQLGFDSLLQTGGVLGFIGVMLGLTQGTWAPDIISGLIILNSSMIEEGDIIDIDDGIIGRVYKTKLFHTEILNLANNHRIMIRNANLRDHTVHNLSKFASAKGLRECLAFNIGYDVTAERVKKMLTDAFATAEQQGVALESKYPPAIKLLDTGDHALCWGILYYVKNVDQLINIRRDFREIILATAIAQNISLATPTTHVVDLTSQSRIENS